jgi:hypothetical protein
MIVMRTRILVLGAALVILGAVPAQAVTVTLYSSNVGITSMTYTVSGNTIDVYETWGAQGYGFLEFSGLTAGVDYTLNKHLTNLTGVGWGRFANELLDPMGDYFDRYDPSPQPAWIPSGFTTSNDQDGLSFAQAFNIPRTSTAFQSCLADELTDQRDFLDFYGGYVAGDGGTNVLSYGLRDNGGFNQPFLVAQRPNESSVPEVPEPSTLLLLGGGLLAAWGSRRRFKH